MKPSPQPAMPPHQRSYVVYIVLALLLMVLMVALYKCRQQKLAAGRTEMRFDTAAIGGLQIPAYRATDTIIAHTAYTLRYLPHEGQAAWVAYVLRGYQVANANEPRTNRFVRDTRTRPFTVGDEDYENSGYDRGHLAPAEDMAWSAKTMRESFYYSNMSPQVPTFNRGVWRRLEELVRFWATAYDSVYVVTGPVLQAGLPTIGHNPVAVPQLFYKAVLVYNPKGAQAIGFLLRNEASAAPLKTFAVSIDSLEHLTNQDFFPRLPDAQERVLEKNFKEREWLWTRRQGGSAPAGEQ